MTYDYHGGTWDDITGLNSPLYGKHSANQSEENWKNANFSINFWISNGCPPNKLNLGLAAYGQIFQNYSKIQIFLLILTIGKSFKLNAKKS